jgi:curved DNA-binding protein CbpA
MKEEVFTDYYETLEISPNANTETIERVFRHLAQRYHPDNSKTGDAFRFSEVIKAHDILKDPEQRARYDLAYERHLEYSPRLAEQAIEDSELDAVIHEKILSILHVKRRCNVQNPGLGILELEHLSGYPREHLEFHLWYLKEKGWISRLDGGFWAITVSGVDQAIIEHKRLYSEKQLTSDQG